MTFVTHLESAPLDRSSKKATRAVLAGVADDSPSRSFRTTLQPDVVRRMIRHGWLHHLETDARATRRLQEAVDSAESMQLRARWEGPAGHLSKYEDAFGNCVTVLVTPDRSAYVRTQSRAPFAGDVTVREVVFEVAPGSDPIAATARPRAAAVLFDGTEVASWDVERGFHADEERWRAFLKTRGLRGGRLPKNWFPPHVLLTDVRGDALSLITAHGAVNLVTDGSPESTRRFLTEAGSALPDAGHLDLIGELLYDYAWDSAEVRRPLLVGTQTENGDWVQTAAQTLATCAGGRFRGDCDDLADFYHTIVRAQGRNAHVMSLPWHLACAWAEKRRGGRWAIYVLHTGSPMVFEGPTVRGALAKVYECFRAGETVDTNALPVAIRFDGEVRRRTLLLGHRIFSDPEYARGVLSVQRDLHAHTYFHGLRTLHGVIDDGQRSAFDEWELAQLLLRVGEWRHATDAYERALALTKSPASRVPLSIELLGSLPPMVGGPEVERLIRTILDTEIPSLETAKGGAVVQPWIRLAYALLRRPAHRHLALQILDESVRSRLAASFEHLQKEVGRPGFEPYRLHYGASPLHLSNVRLFVYVGIEALRLDRSDLSPSGQRAWACIDEDVRRWFEELAFKTVEPHASRLEMYALLGQFHAVHVGAAKLRESVEACPLPDARVMVHPTHIVSDEPSPSDLRWVRTSPEYWQGVWMSHCASRGADLDVEAILTAIRRQREAARTAARLGLAHWSRPNQELAANLAEALVRKDAASVWDSLRAIAERGDHGLNETTVDLLCALVRHMDLDAFGRTVRMWADAIGHKPHYFQIVWSALHAGLPRHALQVALLAVSKHPDEPAFRCELDEIDRRLSSQSARFVYPAGD